MIFATRFEYLLVINWRHKIKTRQNGPSLAGHEMNGVFPRFVSLLLSLYTKNSKAFINSLREILSCPVATKSSAT